MAPSSGCLIFLFMTGVELSFEWMNQHSPSLRTHDTNVFFSECICCCWHWVSQGHYHRSIQCIFRCPFPPLLLLPHSVSTLYSSLPFLYRMYIRDLMYLSKHRAHKRRDVLQYRSFWDLVFLKTLSASHIYIMIFSHFCPLFALISLCPLYDNLQLSSLFWKWHNFVLCRWVKSHCVYRCHFLFICSPGSV